MPPCNYIAVYNSIANALNLKPRNIIRQKIPKGNQIDDSNLKPRRKSEHQAKSKRQTLKKTITV